MKTKLLLPIFALAACTAGAQILFTPNGNIGNSNNQNVGIGVSAPAAKLDLLTNANTGALKIQGRNATAMAMPGEPGGAVVSTPYAIKVEFNQTASSPPGISTTALLDVQGRLFLGEFSTYTSPHNVNTKSAGIGIFGSNNNKLWFTYHSFLATS